MATVPKTYRRLVVTKLTPKFRTAVTIETVDMCEPKDDEICIKNRYVGVNAIDVGICKGHYFGDGKVPFTIGFEGVGEVVKVGKRVTSLKIGDAVGYFSENLIAYAEYVCMKIIHVMKIPETKPEYLVLLCSGLTSAIGLDKAGHIKKGEKVLITAAAGGAGHIAVQWAKIAGCHVIATCSSKEKEVVLKKLGCDRVINYKKEDLGEILSKEYPEGIDVVWETIGGKIFEICLNNLAIKGRLVVVGFVSTYKDENQETLPKLDLRKLSETLMLRSQSLVGYLLTYYNDFFPTYFKYLSNYVESGKIKVIYDLGKEKPFIGLEGIIDGQEFLHTEKSIGKVMVKFY